MYDIVFIGKGNSTSKGYYSEFKTRFPNAKYVTNNGDVVAAFEEARKKVFTQMFWIVWDNIQVLDDFKFDYQVPTWDASYIHVFKNGERYDGVSLFPKKAAVSKRELDHRFFINKKEVDVQASKTRLYDVYQISSYDEYVNAASNSTFDMFWAVWDDVVVDPNFKFDYEVPGWDKTYTHVFLNGNSYDGVCLFPANALVSKREFDHRFFINKKEVDICASTPKPYDIFYIDTYEDYLVALETSTTHMFWMTTYNLKESDDFKYDMYFDYSNTVDKSQTHAFIHLVDNQQLYNGIFLCSKSAVLTKKEVDYRFPINKKEWDVVASGPCQYDKFTITDYADYLKAMEESKTEMFWVIPNEVEPVDDFKFSMYFDHSDSYDRKANHVFKNKDVDGIAYNGIMLLSKSAPVSKREIDFRFLIEKKEHDIVASELKQYDIVFISYNEPNADSNWELLKSKYPRAQRVHGVKGIHQAHIKAAELSATPMFWVVDGDSIVEDTFKFDLLLPKYDRDVVHVWKSRNPVNSLEYGYGGVKLLPKKETINVDVTSADMTTSISKKFKALPDVSNTTSFNTDPFNTWKSAFRECVKLSSKTIAGQVDEETQERLAIWCTVGLDKPYGDFSIKGALAGKAYGQKNAGNQPALSLINDFDWLKNQFEQTH